MTVDSSEFNQASLVEYLGGCYFYITLSACVFNYLKDILILLGMGGDLDKLLW